MAISNSRGFIRRVVDHVTDEVVIVLSGGGTYEFKELFKYVYEGLKEKKAVSGGEEMLRLRCYEKLQKLMRAGLVEKKLKTYRGLKGLDPPQDMKTKYGPVHAGMADATKIPRFKK